MCTKINTFKHFETFQLQKEDRLTLMSKMKEAKCKEAKREG
jgi:hypothetical protein